MFFTKLAPGRNIENRRGASKEVSGTGINKTTNRVFLNQKPPAGTSTKREIVYFQEKKVLDVDGSAIIRGSAQHAVCCNFGTKYR